VRCLLPVVLACGCTPGAAPPPAGVALPIARACAAQCSDIYAQVTVYRDDAGAIGVVSVQGSPSNCSNPPLLFFGPDGGERDGITLMPVTPGSPEAKHWTDVRATATAGFHPAERMLCRDVTR